MTEDIKELQDKVNELEEMVYALIRCQWHERGELKGISGKIEKELEPHIQKWFDKKKGGILPPQN